MEKNIIDGILNILTIDEFNLRESHIRSNRANSMGDALEKFVLDIFCGNHVGQSEETQKDNIDNCFSYIGNDSNPPDAMLKNGDAIEVKKIESRGSQLQLNSSSPHRFLTSKDNKITSKAKEAENWNKKEMIYAVGWVKNNILKELALIDASTYVADTCYENTFDTIKDTISEAIASLDNKNIKLSETTELARINNIDANGFTSLRVRPMWLLNNPFKAFEEYYTPNTDAKFNLISIISLNKWDRLSNSNQLLNKINDYDNLSIDDILLVDPENGNEIKAKKITYFK
ncbi:NgoPII family restriction endonuclease [Vagococcus luciliae]|uniref:Restriction endonuclease n=1 Tax=Vagococcus luciliae TaxID=2920380 RepID=A0ABY5P235_9ENTE|nr:NgoPII family restriction endonuclease [Vagococcus luciliae]UUV99912.1 hypothetical protein G314FT_20810 [Vagococcus luciliae]